MNRRSALLALCGPACLPVALADTGLITMYVPFPAGGTSDVFARALSPGLAAQLQRTVVVENLAGASGSIAANKVLGRGAAGDALFLASPTELILAPATLKAVKYSPNDFRPVHLISRPPLGVYVRADLPANNIDELVALAKSSKDRPLSYGSVGVGSVYHLAGDALMQAAGLNLTHVPYRGGTPLLQDLMGGQLDLAFFPLDGHLVKMLSGGKMRVIRVTSASRSPLLPAAGSFAESKSLPRFSTVDVWGGVFVPKATPEAVVQALHRAAQEAVNRPEVRKSLEAAAGTPLLPPMSLEQLNSFYSQEIAQFQDATRRAHLEAN